MLALIGHGALKAQTRPLILVAGALHSSRPASGRQYESGLPRAPARTSVAPIIVAAGPAAAARGTPPATPASRRRASKGVACGRAVHLRLVDAIGEGSEAREDFGAADDHDLVGAARLRAILRPRECRLEARRHDGAVGAEAVIARDHDVVAAVERLLRSTRTSCRPMMRGLPMVSRRKVLRSEERRQGSSPSRPMTPFSATATTSAIEHAPSHRHRRP